MKANIGTTNRVIRAIIGLVIIGAGVYYKNWFGALGIIPLLSAATGCCFLACGTKSCDMKEPKKEDSHTKDKGEHKHGDGCNH